jgi:hypothetical protein
MKFFFVNLLLCVIAFSQLQAEPRVSVTYTRTLNAETAGMIASAHTGNENFLSGEVRDFWVGWRHRDAEPVLTPDFERLLDPYFLIGLEIGTSFAETSRQCFAATLDRVGLYWEAGEAVFSGSNAPDCSRYESQVGALFAIVENLGTAPFFDLDVYYLSTSPRGIDFENLALDVLDRADLSLPYDRVELMDQFGRLEAQLDLLEREQPKKLNIPYLPAGGSLIWLMGFYVRNSDGFEDFYLSDIYRLSHFQYKKDGRDVLVAARQPGRTASARLWMPYGWYSQ